MNVPVKPIVPGYIATGGIEQHIYDRLKAEVEHCKQREEQLSYAPGIYRPPIHVRQDELEAMLAIVDKYRAIEAVLVQDGIACNLYANSEPIKCGWKSTVVSVQWIMEGKN